MREVLMERCLDLERKGVEVEVAEDLPCIEADSFRLQQVFANLLDNAIKYMGENLKPRIRVGWHPEGRMARLFFGTMVWVSKRRIWKRFSGPSTASPITGNRAWG